jgi:hypothetical protein
MKRTTSERRRHLATLDRIVQDWENGKLSTSAKREAIASENTWYYGTSKNSRRVTGLSLTAVAVPTVPAAEPDDDTELESWWLR